MDIEKVSIKRVYCENCKWLGRIGIYGSPKTDGACFNDNNQISENDWYSNKYEMRVNPEKLNKYNNCGWYEYKDKKGR